MAHVGELRSAGDMRTQQVTCRMALVSGGFCFSSPMACSVGTMNNSTLRRLASSCTSFITGKAPLPVPTIRRRHFHGIPSSSESGVCPKASRNFLEAFFFVVLQVSNADKFVAERLSCVLRLPNRKGCR